MRKIHFVRIFCFERYNERIVVDIVEIENALNEIIQIEENCGNEFIDIKQNYDATMDRMNYIFTFGKYVI